MKKAKAMKNYHIRTDEDLERSEEVFSELIEKNKALIEALKKINDELGDKQSLALTRILKDIVVETLQKYDL